MLTLSTGRRRRDCSGLTRRDFIQAGTLGLGGLTLPWLLRHKAAAAEGYARESYVNDKAVVLLFLSGGASHIETFNPNMDAPAPYHSVTGEVQTTVPGVTFGGTYPLLARHAHKMAVVRSFRHSIGNHVKAIVHMLTGGTDPTGDGNEGFSMGSMYARLRGANHPDTGMPTFSLLNSEEVDPQYRNEKGRVERGSRPGPLGPAFAPFLPGGGGPAVENMTLNVSRDRLDDRRSLLDALDGLKRQAEADAQLGGIDGFKQQAFDLILGSAAEAFDLSKEDLRLVDRYDTGRFRIGKKSFRDSDLGRLMLTARRLVEAGCGFVTVHSAGWDMHSDSNNPGILAGMEMLGRPMDKAVSAFLEDLEDRGLSDKVLLIVTGDFGRTPKINNRGGRDHWAALSTLAFAGGGLNMGQAIGESGRRNDAPVTDPISTGDLMATVMHTLFDIGTLRLARGVPRDLVSLLENGRPIEALF
jgi:hypothetical protein